MSRSRYIKEEVIRDFALETRHLLFSCASLFYAGGTFHLRGETESSFKPTF